MAYISQYQYYENNGNSPENENWGSYQYVSLEDIVNNFMLMYTGDRSLINNEPRFKILFHAKKAIQELNYDAMKEVKVLELDVDKTIRLVLPHDYVNWVRISMYKDGILYPLSENRQVNFAESYLQDNQGKILFDQNGDILKPEFSTVDIDRITGQQRTMYLNDGHQFDGEYGYQYEGMWYFEAHMGQRFGLNTGTANSNPTFRIDRRNGVIHFSSKMSGERCVIEYISDGMENGNDSNIAVNKMFEEFVYAYIRHAILDNKLGVQEYIVRRAFKKANALKRNARIRMSDIHPGRLLMDLRGQNKWLK